MELLNFLLCSNYYGYYIFCVIYFFSIVLIIFRWIYSCYFFLFFCVLVYLLCLLYFFCALLCLLWLCIFFCVLMYLLWLCIFFCALLWLCIFFGVDSIFVFSIVSIRSDKLSTTCWKLTENLWKKHHNFIWKLKNLTCLFNQLNQQNYLALFLYRIFNQFYPVMSKSFSKTF